MTFPEKNISNDRAELILEPLLAEQSLWSDPGFFPGVYCRVVPVEEDDPRVALRGHNGKQRQHRAILDANVFFGGGAQFLGGEEGERDEFAFT